MKILLTGGGTGGSVTPLLAVANYLKKRNPKTEFLWIGTKDGPEKSLAAEQKIGFKAIYGGKLRRYFDWQNFIDPILIILGFFQSIFIIIKFKPQVIVSAGSFVSVPVVWAGWFCRIPSLIHQMDLMPGLANKLMAPVASKITVAFEKSLADFNSKKVILTGNPVREELLSGSKDEARKIFNLEHYLPTVLFIGGGTGALRLNEIVAEALPELVKFCQVIHLTGKNRSPVSEENSQKIEGNKLSSEKLPRYHSYEFLFEDLKDAYVIADLVVSRSGMGVLTELSMLNKASILIPLPDTPQEENAKFFDEKNAAIVLSQKNFTADHILGYIKYLLENKDVLAKLQRNIGLVMKKNALELIAGEIIKLRH